MSLSTLNVMSSQHLFTEAHTHGILRTSINMLIFLTIEESKLIISTLIRDMQQWVVQHGGEHWQTVLDFVWWLKRRTTHIIREVIRKVLTFIGRKNIVQSVPTIETTSTTVSLQFESNVPLMKALIAYVSENRDRCDYLVNDGKKVTVENLDELNYTEEWVGLTVRLAEMKVIFDAPLILKFKRMHNRHDNNQHQQNCQLVDFSTTPARSTKSPAATDINSITSFSDLLPTSTIRSLTQSEISKQTQKSNNETVVFTRDDVEFYDKFNTDFNIESNMSLELAIISVFKKAFPNLDEQVALYEMAYFASELEKLIFIDVYSVFQVQISTGRFVLFGKEIPVVSEDAKLIKGLGTNHKWLKTGLKNSLHMITRKMWNKDVTPSEVQVYKTMFEKMKADAQVEMQDTETATVKRSAMVPVRLVVENPNTSTTLNCPTESEMCARFYNFVGDLGATPAADVDAADEFKAKVFSVSIKRTVVEKTTTANKDFEQFEDQMAILRSSEIDEKELVKMAKKAPPRTVTIEKTQSEVTVDFINEKSKPLSTLYIRKIDMLRLKSTLESFAHRKDALVRLGLPNKLGVLFYGLPGTGKTSAILAIATHLRKNIYYVHLNTIQSNEELQKIFDHVNKNCVNGGIIVFEDVDAMTDVVHKRTEEKRQNTQFTLEYFLNLLQGSLTQEGSIFVATTNHLDQLDPAFYRDGRFDVRIELQKCDHYQLQTMYQQLMGRSIPEHILSKIPENTYTPATFIFGIRTYMFGDYSDDEILSMFIQNAT